jgi:RNA polymerase sigma-70 factor (ECF subfamily)
MTVTSRATLLQLLLVRYDDLKRRLTRRLGSAELAGEALQDTFIRLECTPQIGPVQNPQAYLARMAFNIAANYRVAENRRLTVSESEALLDIPDEAPDPARTIEARSEIEALKRALAELAPRRRDIFMAAWVEEVPHSEIAARYDVSVRTIQIELKHALEHCSHRLDRNITKKFATRPRRLSSD